ncbi:MAG TPA: DNA repair protein RadC [Chitinophagaceae bacterium]
MSAIKHWNTDDRPREKLIHNGAESLSNSELLAILINNGTKDASAVDLSRQLLSAVNNDLQRLGRMSVQEILQLHTRGIGQAKAISIVAALELGVRRNAQENLKVVVSHSSDVANYLRARLQHKKHEVFVAVYLNRSNKIKHHEIISSGGITGTVADPRVILKRALEHDATSLILCHNHPSGSLKPSKADEDLTWKIREAARYFDIAVLDHIIVSDEGYYSFADEGLM